MIFIKKLLRESFVPKIILSHSQSGESFTRKRQWHRRNDFLITVMGYVIGYGNLIRFPQQVHNYSGGSFLLIYSLLLFLFGIPMLLIDFSIGQFSSRNMLKIYKMVPLFLGEGWCMLLMCGCILLINNTLTAWNYYYLIASLTAKLPWTSCGNKFNSIECITIDEINKNKQQSDNNSISHILTAAEYWFFHVTKIRSYNGTMSLKNYYPTLPQIPMIGCLFFSWVLISLFVIFSIKLQIRIFLFSIIVPIIGTTLLIILGFTLPGSKNGIYFYFIPRINEIFHPFIVIQAIQQIIYSLGIGLGGLITFASYNDFHDNFVRDALFIVVLDYFISFMSGLATFTNLGYISYLMEKDIRNLSLGRYEMFYVTYPTILSTLYASHALIVIFFLNIITIGSDANIIIMDVVYISICQRFYKHIETFRERALLITIISLVMFMINVLLINPTGIYILILFDDVIIGNCLMFIVIIKTLVIGLIYGLKNYHRDITMMITSAFSIFWIVYPLIIVPGIIIVLTIASFVMTKYSDYQGYHLSQTVMIVCYVSVIIFCSPILICSLKRLRGLQLRHPNLSICVLLKHSIEPSPSWGPLNKFNWTLSKFYITKMRNCRDNSEFQSSLIYSENVNTILTAYTSMEAKEINSPFYSLALSLSTVSSLSSHQLGLPWKSDPIIFNRDSKLTTDVELNKKQQI